MRTVNTKKNRPIVETDNLCSLAQDERNLALMLQRTQKQWGGDKDLWVFGYASLIWRPEFDFAERRPARVHGWHRALRMWSHVNRGTEGCPGLVFAMLSGGSCQGMVFRIPQRDALVALGVSESSIELKKPEQMLASGGSAAEARRVEVVLSGN